MKQRFCLTRFTILTLCLSISPAKADGVEYSFGRAPQVSASSTNKDWTPFINYLKKESKINLKLVIYRERESFEQDILQGILDFFYGNPGYQVIAHELHGYLPLLRSNKRQLTGILVVSRDGGINQLSDLQDKIIAFPDTSAFAASLYLSSLLRNQEHLRFKAEYVGGHDNVYRNVVSGRYAAGGGVIRTLEREPANLQEKLRILFKTPSIASHPIAAKPQVPEAVREKLTNAIINMEKTDRGRDLLDNIKFRSPVRADYDKDYLPIRDMAKTMYQFLLTK